MLSLRAASEPAALRTLPLSAVPMPSAAPRLPFTLPPTPTHPPARSLEYLTPLAPQHFLPMASLANVGKSIGLTTFIATQPAFHRSFCLRENLADISAKTQAQQMVVDNLGLAAAVGLTYLCRHSGAGLGGGGPAGRAARAARGGTGGGCRSSAVLNRPL